MRGRGATLLVVLAALAAGCAAAPEAGAPTPPTLPALGCASPCTVEIATGRLWEPMVAVDPTDPLHLVASSQLKGEDDATGGTSWALSHVSFDGGATWETRRLPGGQDAPPGHPLATTTWMDDSVPLFLADGTLVWIVLAFEVVDQPPVAGVAAADLVALRSHDGGRTFPEVVVVAEGRGGDAVARDPVQGGRFSVTAHEGHDKPWATLADDGTILLAWSRNLAGRPDECGTDLGCTRLMLSTSRDGRSWTEPRIVTDQVVSGAFPLALADGTWLLSYHATQEQEVVVARSTDAGATWTHETLGASTKFPVLARAPIAGGERVHLAYPRGQDDRDGEQQVVLRSSDDGGLTWGPEVLVHAPAAPGRTIPALAPAPDGGAIVAYWSPEAGGETARFLAARVQDGVVGPEIALGTHAGPTSVTGDYLGLAPLPDGGAVAVWTASEGDEMRLLGDRISIS